MTEWGVYLVVASLLATGFLIARPVIALTRTNTKLECAVEKLTETMTKTENRMQVFETENRAGHRRIWKQIEKQDALLHSHTAAIERRETAKKQEKGRQAV